MSLQVWLPLNGNLNNQGLNGVIPTNNGAVINNAGKIGKCYSFGTAASDITLPATSMTNFTTGASVSFWIKILSWNTSYATFFQAGPASTAWTAYRFGILRNNANSNLCFTISNGSSASNASYTTSNLELNTWYHLSFCYKTGHCLIYINGILYKDYATTIVPDFSGITTIKIGRCTNNSSYQTNCLLNDFRIYDHCLSDKEVEEIAKGLVLHYKLDNGSMGNPNILTGTYYNSYGSSLAAASTARNVDGKWAAGSGGNGTFSVIEDSSCPVGIYSWNITNNTSGNRDFQQGDQPYISGQIYTTSFWAKGSGTCLYRSWNSTDGKQMFSKTWTLTSVWTYYTYTFTASAEMATDSCTFHLGVTGSASISICGMKMELGSQATPYSTAPGELNVNKTIVYDSSGYQNNSTLSSSLITSTDTAKYFVSNYFGAYNTPYTALIDTSLLPALTNCTVTYWGKYDTTKTLLLTGDTTSKYLMASNANTFYHAAAGSPIVYKNGVAGTYTCTAGSWDFFAIKNVNLSLWTQMKINSYGSSWPLKGFLSDFRIYATALTDDQILELYNTSATIDNKGNIYARELVET